LLFKGQYVKKGGGFAISGIEPTPKASDFKYYLYPLVYVNEAANTIDYYRNIERCVVVEHKKNNDNGLICQDSYL
jgi:hypothetical protein